jgi:hypothetical protein
MTVAVRLLWPSGIVHASVLFIFTFLSVASVASAALARPSESPCPQDAKTVSPEPISNIRVNDILEPVVSALLLKSATFRRQWDTISASRFIRVTIVLRPGMQGWSRARTEISHFAYGAIRARIELPNATDLTELLAHELEHVVEQLEGLDLRALAARHEGGVVEVRKGIYETARARAAGLQVYREVYGDTDPALEAAFGGVRRAWRSIRSGSRPQTGSTTHEPGSDRRQGGRSGAAAHLHKRW